MIFLRSIDSKVFWKFDVRYDQCSCWNLLSSQDFQTGFLLPLTPPFISVIDMHVLVWPAAQRMLATLFLHFCWLTCIRKCSHFIMLNLVFSLHNTSLFHFRSCWISKFNLCIIFYFISWVNLIQHDMLIMKSHLACVIHIAICPTQFFSSTFLLGLIFW